MMGDEGRWTKEGRLVKKDGKWQWITKEDRLQDRANVTHESHHTTQGKNRFSESPKGGGKNPNFRSFDNFSTSIFVSNLPWKASNKDLWNSCNQWGSVVDFFIANIKSISGHRFGFVRFKNVKDINLLVNNIRATWMGNFHLFADVARYSWYDKKKKGHVEVNKPENGSFKSNHHANVNGKSYADVLSGNKGEKAVTSKGEHSTKDGGDLNHEVEDVFVIDEANCMDYLSRHNTILAKVNKMEVINDIQSHASAAGF